MQAISYHPDRAAGPLPIVVDDEKERVYQGKMYTKSRNNMSGVLIAAAVVGALLSAGSAALAAEDEMQPAVNYANAGISMAMPKGFVFHVASDPSIVVRAGLRSGRQSVQAVTLRAFCVVPKASASELADSADKALEEQLSVRKFRALKSVSIKVAGITGVARLLKYSYDGNMTTAARVFFIRAPKGDGVHICYVLSVEVQVKYEQELLPTLDKVIKNAKLTTVQAPSSIPTRLSEARIKDYRGGFSVRVPEGWYGMSVKGGVSLGQKNYLIGGANSPQLAILAAQAGPLETAQSFARKAMSKYLAATTRPNSGVEILAEGPAKIGDQDAYQYVLKYTAVLPTTRPADSTATSKPADKDKVVRVGRIEAVRVICRLDNSGQSARAYLFALSCVENEAKFVIPWLDTVGKGFEYLPMTGEEGKRDKPGSKSTAPKL